MGDYQVISGVSSGLANLLQDHLSAQLGNAVQVDLRSPPEIGTPTNQFTVSLWLYRVARDEFMFNVPPDRVVADQLPRPPMPVDLHYLVTPLHRDAGTAQVLLGGVMQALNDHAILRAADLGTPSPLGTDELRLTFETLTLDELHQIWYALSEPYHLSVSYVAQVVSIESGHEPVQTAPIVERRARYEQIVGAES